MFGVCKRKLVIDGISIPREGSPALSLSVVGEGVTIDVGEVIISARDLDRIQVAFAKWDAAVGVTKSTMDVHTGCCLHLGDDDE